MTILTVGIDLAKNVFAVHGVNEAGKAELVRPAVPRDKLHELIASLPPCVIGMEACSGAHHWARLFQASGHTVRLIAPKFVVCAQRAAKPSAAAKGSPSPCRLDTRAKTSAR
jgi:transposase